MKLLADMGVSARVVDWLRQEGHEVSSLPEKGLQKLSDEQIFVKAEAGKSVVLTFDLDFGEILALSGGHVVSAVLFRLKNTTTPFVIRRLKAVLPDTAEALNTGAIIVVEDGRH